MTNDELYDDIQEVKTAFVITFLIVVYCFFEIIKFNSAHIEWKVICSSVGFIVVSAVDIVLFIQLIRLQREFKNIPRDSD
ncbi:MAG TPA: hypothetical protein VK671_17905 [Mucilaginibacter sp.]|jgi:hypothetical protein|nr:hypothetical protein [Mucilaginibacter sp.]